MATVTLSGKHQITLPVELVRSLKLEPGDKLVVELVDDHLIVLPEPKSWTDYFSAGMKGVYGDTVEEIDRYVAEVRHGWTMDGLKLAIRNDHRLRRVYEAIPWPKDGMLRLSELAEKTGTTAQELTNHLAKLVELDAVKCVPNPADHTDPYYMRMP